MQVPLGRKPPGPPAVLDKELEDYDKDRPIQLSPLIPMDVCINASASRNPGSPPTSPILQELGSMQGSTGSMPQSFMKYARPMP